MLVIDDLNRKPGSRVDEDTQGGSPVATATSLRRSQDSVVVCRTISSAGSSRLTDEVEERVWFSRFRLKQEPQGLPYQARLGLSALGRELLEPPVLILRQ